MKKSFLADNEEILYQPQKDIKIFLWYASSLTICLVFIIFAVFISVSLLTSALNLANFSFFTLTFAGLILFTYKYIILLSDFFFTHTYMTNKKMVITKTFSKKIEEIQFKDIEYCFSFAFTSVCIKQRDDKNYCISFVKSPHLLVEKIIAKSPSSITAPTIYKNKINEYMLLIFLNIPFLALYLTLLFNTGHIKSFYYEFMGNKSLPQCHSLAECKNIRTSTTYAKNIKLANNYYLKALSYAPENYILYAKITDAYIELKQYNEAVSILKTELLFRPQNERIIYFKIGEIYKMNKKYDLAIENFKKCLTLKQTNGFSDDVFVNLNLASIYKKIGDIKQSKIYEDKVKNINLPAY